ncbi:hypothetical protein KIL84_016148 [Mauremys mutica]|uniref:Uncharacterized protein n=1 Tax=Mauremys mutica TaxID=74926 RepID=A0A9D3WTZ5_9SAUR|nr:hypothetical protein KIL84_016148 [Mauremys mutica]
MRISSPPPPVQKKHGPGSQPCKLITPGLCKGLNSSRAALRLEGEIPKHASEKLRQQGMLGARPEHPPNGAHALPAQGMSGSPWLLAQCSERSHVVLPVARSPRELQLLFSREHAGARQI